MKEGLHESTQVDFSEDDLERENGETFKFNKRATASQNDEEEGEADELPDSLGERVNEWIRQYLPWW